MNACYLFVGCAVLVILCWLIFKDIFSPVSVICEVFAVSSFFAIISAKSRETDITVETAVFILVMLLAGIFVAVLFKLGHRRGTVIEQFPTPIAINMLRYKLLLLAVIAMTGIYSGYYLRAIWANSGETFAQKLAVFRQASVTGEISGIPAMVQYMSKAIYAFAYFSTYIFVHDFLVVRKTGFTTKIPKIYLISIMMLTITALLTGARAELVYFVVFVLVIQSIIRSKLYSKQFSFKGILRIVMFGVVALLLFYVMSHLIGRSGSGFIDTIAGYFGAPIVALDRYLENATSSSAVWGKETFYSLVHLLQKVGFVKQDVGTIHLDYVYINGAIYTNVYTAFRFYVSDFGIFGSVLVHCLCVLFYESMYYRCNCRFNQLGYVNKRILIYGLISYGLFLYFYSNYFFALVLSLHTFLQIICVYLFAIFTKCSRKTAVRRLNEINC